MINLKAWSQRDPYVKKNDREGAAPPLRKLAVTDLLAGLSAESRPEDQTKAVAGIADSLPMSPSSPSTTRHEPVSSPSTERQPLRLPTKLPIRLRRDHLADGSTADPAETFLMADVAGSARDAPSPRGDDILDARATRRPIFSSLPPNPPSAQGPRFDADCIVVRAAGGGEQPVPPEAAVRDPLRFGSRVVVLPEHGRPVAGGSRTALPDHAGSGRDEPDDDDGAVPPPAANDFDLLFPMATHGATASAAPVPSSTASLAATSSATTTAPSPGPAANDLDLLFSIPMRRATTRHATANTAPIPKSTASLATTSPGYTLNTLSFPFSMPTHGATATSPDYKSNVLSLPVSMPTHGAATNTALVPNSTASLATTSAGYMSNNYIVFPLLAAVSSRLHGEHGVADQLHGVSGRHEARLHIEYIVLPFSPHFPPGSTANTASVPGFTGSRSATSPGHPPCRPNTSFPFSLQFPLRSTANTTSVPHSTASLATASSGHSSRSFPSPPRSALGPGPSPTSSTSSSPTQTAESATTATSPDSNTTTDGHVSDTNDPLTCSGARGSGNPLVSFTRRSRRAPGTHTAPRGDVSFPESTSSTYAVAGSPSFRNPALRPQSLTGTPDADPLRRPLSQREHARHRQGAGHGRPGPS